MIPQEITNAIAELNQIQKKTKDLILAEIDRLARNKYHLDCAFAEGFAEQRRKTDREQEEREIEEAETNKKIRDLAEQRMNEEQEYYEQQQQQYPEPPYNEEVEN